MIRNQAKIILMKRKKDDHGYLPTMNVVLREEISRQTFIVVLVLINNINYFQEHHHLMSNNFRRSRSVDNLEKVLDFARRSWLYFDADLSFINSGRCSVSSNDD